MTSRRTRTALAGTWAILPFALLLLAVSVWPPPDRVPTHWTGDLPDGFSSGGGLFTACLSVAGFCAAVSALVVLLGFLAPAQWARAVLALLAALGAGAAAVYGTSVVGTRLAGAPEQVHVVWALLPVPIALGWGTVAWWLARPGPVDREAVRELVPERSRVVPQTGVPVTPWATRTRSAVLLTTAMFVLVVVGLSAVLLWALTSTGAVVVGVTAVAAGAYTAAWGNVEVRVDAAGLTIRSLLAPLTLLRVPADQVVGVETADLDPMKWGGIGLRWLPDRTAYIVRGGPGIVVHRASGRRFAVEVTEGQEVAEVGTRALLLSAARAAAGGSSA